MDRDCVVFGCRNSSTFSQTTKNDCAFFNFPLDKPDLVNKWLENLSLEGWIPGMENVVCEEHFSSNFFEIVNEKRTLKREAVPNMVDNLEMIFANNEMLIAEENIEENCSKDFRCRICANFLLKKNAIYIYSEDESVMEKMMACIPILVKTVDCLPKYICKLCLADLNVSYRMLVRAIDSEKLFNNLLNKFQDKVHENENEGNEIITNDKNQTCVICNLYFKDINELNCHFQKKHVDELDFNDRNNDKQSEKNFDKFENDQLCLVDMKNSNNNPKDLNGELELKSDFPDKNPSEKFDCDVCPMTFNTRDILWFHKETLHKDNHVKSKENDYIHLDKNDDSDDSSTHYLACELCLQICNTSEELKNHMETHAEKHGCSICGLVCQDEEKLNEHKEAHVKFKDRNECPICFKVFLTPTDLCQHSKDIHKLKNVKENNLSHKWICRYCGKEIGTKLSLSIHERIHTGVRPYVCECCGKSFRSKANLIQHQPVHTGIKRYKCTVCNKAFARKAFVTTHMRVHTGERPFKCEICGRRYTQIGDLRRHKKKHLTTPTEASKNIVEDTLTNIEIEECDYPDEEVSVDPSTMFESNSLIKLHFAKDVSDFRRILVELQQ